MNIESGPQWYVVHTHPHGEIKAAQHLKRQGFNAYLPRYLKRTRHARRVRIAPAPLFPRYLFVAIDISTQRWRSILSTIGVANLVCNGDRPAAIQPGIIEGLQRREDQTGLVQLAPFNAFRVGDKVRVVDGPFVECFGLFEGMSDADRVTILLELLGRKVRVLLDTDFIVAA